MEEHDHQVCELKERIAVLEEREKGAAMALVLADKIARLERQNWLAVILAFLAVLSRFIKF